VILKISQKIKFKIFKIKLIIQKAYLFVQLTKIIDLPSKLQGIASIFALRAFQMICCCFFFQKKENYFLISEEKKSLHEK